MRNFPSHRAGSASDAAHPRQAHKPRADARPRSRDTAREARAIRFTDWALI